MRQAQNGFGVCLEFGISVEDDLTIAGDYFTGAADQADSEGLNNLGFCFELWRGRVYSPL
jgi:TPR repeat protein